MLSFKLEDGSRYIVHTVFKPMSGIISFKGYLLSIQYGELGIDITTEKVFTINKVFELSQLDDIVEDIDVKITNNSITKTSVAIERIQREVVQQAKQIFINSVAYIVIQFEEETIITLQLQAILKPL